MAKKDLYRRVRRALRRIRDYVRWVETVYPNRASRRRVLYEGQEMKRLHHQLHLEKTKVGKGRRTLALMEIIDRASTNR